MSPGRVLPLLAVLAVGVGSPLAAQEQPPAAAVPEAPEPPALLAELEEARSRSCVPVFATLAELEADLAPAFQRAQRINALGQAIRLEDSAEVAPFDADRPLEARVRAWFESDAALGRAWAESGDSTVLERRRSAREALLEELRDSIRTLNEEAEARVAGAGDVQAATARCEGKILVRPAVLEVCDTVSSPVCEAARSARSGGAFRFVDEAADLWDVEQLSPWSEPGPLARTPDGALVGARTAGSVRRGNVRFMAGLGHVVRAREQLTPEEAAEFDANLDSLGFTFDHPDLVMAPAIDVLLDIPGALAGESHWFLHFGDLSEPASQVVWTMPVAAGGPMRASVPVGGGALARLQAGETLSLTAVRMAAGAEAGDATEAEALYSLPLTPVSQAGAVDRLLSYMVGGGFSEDLSRLVPPSDGP